MSKKSKFIGFCLQNLERPKFTDVIILEEALETYRVEYSTGRWCDIRVLSRWRHSALLLSLNILMRDWSTVKMAAERIVAKL